GIDIGNEIHYVAVPPSRDSQPVQRFGCTTGELRTMANWLKQCRIRTVAMQSTGVYWISVYDILEQAGLEVYLVNARDTKNLPGRKSDVQESQWLMKLHTYGLLRNSFRPAQEIRTMRTYWRQRNDLVQSASRHIPRKQMAECERQLEKYLQQREDRSHGAPLPEEKRKGRLKKTKGNKPQFDLRTGLFHLSGTDLTQIDGIDVMTASSILSEAGWDMRK